MNTTAHLIFGAAAFGRPDARRVVAAALTGALIPDVSLYFMVGWQRWVEGRSLTQIFERDYGDPFWQAVFAVDNSIILWAGLLMFALATARAWAVAFAGAALLHVTFDLLLHHNDARRHFWPVSDWVFNSPLSYWDPDHYGWLIGPLEVSACIGLGLLLWRRFLGGFSRGMIVIALLLEVMPAIVFPLLFASH